MNILEGNRKKMLLLFLCLLLIFAGCSQKGQKGEETAEERTQETEIEKESEKLAEGYREIYERQQKKELWIHWKQNSRS